MARHFLGLFILIVATLAAVSWAQDRLLQGRNNTDQEDGTLKVSAALLGTELKGVPPGDWQESLAALQEKTGSAMEIFNTRDIAGEDALKRLERGEVVRLRPNARESWAMVRLDDNHLVAFKSQATDRRDWLDWGTTAAFYAVIALVLMLWIWPLARDLRALEAATAQYGNRNWTFGAKIKPYSQVYGLAESFRKMAARIDELIESHKDMSNALSHEIKTPLSRMKFELEFAHQASDMAAVRESLDHVVGDIDAINKLIRATLEYAVLERADFELNMDAHDFAALLPAAVAAATRELEPRIAVNTQVSGEASQVRCDMHLMETALKNLLYNAGRYARREICVSFHGGSSHELRVEDDGPGIPEQDWQRAFGSFVKLDPSNQGGFGLGLAIVKRAVEAHGGTVSLARSTLGGAAFVLCWPR
ncbi:MAG TPA: ATP-binding protein [Steroidobacteraceae bacterium]